MRGIIVGFGTIATGHALGYAQSDGIEITAVVDPSPDRCAVAERDFGLRGYSTIADMLRQESPDFLDICAPPHVHLSYACAGLSSGLHVLCEKPVFPVTSGTDFDRLRTVIGASRTAFYPAHNYKFAPILAAMRRISQSDGFGDVLGARFRTLRSGHAVGVPEWKPDWRRDRRIAGGGILMDHGPHSIYLAVLLTRSTPRMVSCISGRMSADHYADTEDTVLLRILGEGDVRIDLDLSWAAGCRNSFYSLTGSQGTVIVENDHITYSLHGQVSADTLRSNFDDPSHREWFRAMFLDFRRVVEEPERQWPLVAEAWMTSSVIAAAYRSAAAKGEWTAVEPLPTWLVSRLPGGRPAWVQDAARGRSPFSGAPEKTDEPARRLVEPGIPALVGEPTA
jgi:predicted dehydrogenase